MTATETALLFTIARGVKVLLQPGLASIKERERVYSTLCGLLPEPLTEEGK